MALLKTVRLIWAGFRNGLNSTLVRPDIDRHAAKYRNMGYRVKASTLMETLVATVLIVIIFMVASMILNNMLSSNIRQHTELAEERLNILEYRYRNDGLTLPYYEDFESWEIRITKEQNGNQTLVLLVADNPTTKKTITNHIFNEL